MKLAIMQPYFCPYVGYFQLINAVDEFVIYDNIEYTKKGWINRNRILVGHESAFITLPLKKDSDYLNVSERFLSDTWINEKQKLLNKIKSLYKKAPYFDQSYLIIEHILMHENVNLFDFIYHSIIIINKYLKIKTKITISSVIPINHKLKSVDKVIDICATLRATTYINAIGGQALYCKETFKKADIELKFLKSTLTPYNQFKNEFVPGLSIIDVMMFNSVEEIRSMLQKYELV